MIRLLFRALETLITICIGLVLGLVVEWDGMSLSKHMESWIHRMKARGETTREEMHENVAVKKKDIEEHLQDGEKEALNAVLEK